ncbi:MAG TPA: hypothetical protein VGE74_13900, partial [Gemmata sp.]
RVGAYRVRWEAVLWVALVAFGLTLIAQVGYPPVENGELIVRVGPVAVLGAFAFACTIALLLRGTSTSHYAWRRLVLGSLLLIPLGSLGTASLLNGALDRSPEVTRDQVIVEKYTTRSKNATKYHVRCASWRGAGETLSFPVSGAQHGAVVVGQSRMVLGTHAGWLGVEWRANERVELKAK